MPIFLQSEEATNHGKRYNNIRSNEITHSYGNGWHGGHYHLYK